MDLNKKLEYQLQNAGVGIFMVFLTYAAGQSMVNTPLEVNMSLASAITLFIFCFLGINLFRDMDENDKNEKT